MAFYQWSKTAATNASADPAAPWPEGMPPAQVNDSARGLMASAAQFRDDTSGLLVTGGTSTAYTVTTNQVLPGTPSDGQLIVVTFHTANGASATLAADGGTAFPLQISPGTALPSATVTANDSYALKFRAASNAWVFQGAGAAASVTAGAVTNAGLANMAAWTIKLNNSSGSAAPQDSTIDALTLKATPAAADEVMIWDAAGAAMKKATLPSLGNANTAPTVQRFTSGSGNYTPTAGTVRARVRMLPGAGGGAAQTTNNGGNGGDSSFGSWTAIHGNGAVGAVGGAGGTGGVNGTGTLIVRLSGAQGQGGIATSVSGIAVPGGAGGVSPFGGAGAGSQGGTGGAAAANTGSGGAGGGVAGTSNNVAAGGGGGAGEYVEFWVTAPGVTAFVVGTGGNGGAAGVLAGGNGAAGQIIVEEFYI